MPTMRSRVDCGLGLTMASFSPTMRLSSVDLPALGFPATVTMPARGMGGSGVRCGYTNASAEGLRHLKVSDRKVGDQGVPATAYSPALSRAEYHRRCRA